MQGPLLVKERVKDEGCRAKRARHDVGAREKAMSASPVTVLARNLYVSMSQDRLNTYDRNLSTLCYG